MEIKCDAFSSIMVVYVKEKIIHSLIYLNKFYIYNFVNICKN